MLPEEIFIDRLTAVRHTLTANNLSTKALDEAMSAHHELVSSLVSEADMLADQIPLPAPVSSKIVREHSLFNSTVKREPCGRPGCCD